MGGRLGRVGLLGRVLGRCDEVKCSAIRGWLGLASGRVRLVHPYGAPTFEYQRFRLDKLISTP